MFYNVVRRSHMSKQIDKLQLLFTLEKSLWSAQYQQQKKQFLLVSIAIAFGLLAVLAANVAVFLHLSELTTYAKNAWIIVAINLVLVFILVVLLVSHAKKSPPEQAANNIRDALIEEIKTNTESSLQDVQKSIEQVQQLRKDIKMFSEGGLTALIPLIKLAAEVTGKKGDKNKTQKE